MAGETASLSLEILCLPGSLAFLAPWLVVPAESGWTDLPFVR